MSAHPTKIMWLPGAQPRCTRCSSQIRVYMIFLDDNPVTIGTWCPLCDDYSGNVDHWSSWMLEAEKEVPGVCERGVLRIPQDPEAWEFARKFMQGPGTRATRPSPTVG